VSGGCGIAIRLTRRIDGQPILEQPITAADGSTRQSPFVMLDF
jgi:hypothetical protein